MNLVEGKTRIRCLETDKRGTVRDVLALQFTVDYDDDTFGFKMKKYWMVDWEYEK